MADTEEFFDFLAPAGGPGEIGRLGSYRVTGQIGAGGMGIVFRAEDPILKRPIALKVMKRSLSAGESARRRFLREAQAIAALDHDHVVAIYQAGEDRGDSLPRDAAPPGRDPRRPGPTRRACSLCRRPFGSSARLPRGWTPRIGRGLVHRDIKPANLWLEGGSRPGEDSRLRPVEEPGAGGRPEPSGQIAGTPHYMSPEQAQGGLVTPLCDLFSLGCVLY